MCGIIGILGAKPVQSRLIEALERLEYRGYDSAGLAVLDETGALIRRRAAGKLKALEAVLETDPVDGPAGIGHTRWATHGAATTANAHPHQTGPVAVVHNGIIENFKELRAELAANGAVFESQTDTEVIAHMLARAYEGTGDAIAAFAQVLQRLQGAFALAVLFQDQPDLMLGARRGSPLAIGSGEGEMYLGSDALALAPLTRKVIFLEDGDWAVLHRDSHQIYDELGRAVTRPLSQSMVSGALVDKGNYRHFMLKEIHEQPTVVGQTLGRYLDPLTGAITLPKNMDVDFAAVPKLTIIACGTAYFAGMVARYWFEAIARLPVEVEVASEFRYRDPVLPPGGGALFISQSGETADTLAALELCKQEGQQTIAIVNVPDSSLCRSADHVLPTFAGPEVGVASTKAFTCQLAVLACLAVHAARQRGQVSQDRADAMVAALEHIPSKMADMLAHEGNLAGLCETHLAKARDVLYLGRGINYPMALEGALKLKEISYIHAEGYAAGEMKHGPIALIDENVPIIIMAPRDAWFDKTISNMQEAMARKAQVILMSCADGCEAHGEGTIGQIAVPAVEPIAAPLLYAIPLQLLAYHTAVAKGTDVDQPRNLAKSVTVE